MGTLIMTKHEIIVRGALRIYMLIVSNTFNNYPLRELDGDGHKGHILKCKSRAIIAHDRHLIRFTK